jgi:hypothetical protein
MRSRNSTSWAFSFSRAKNSSILIHPDGTAEYEMGSFEENRKNIDELICNQGRKSIIYEDKIINLYTNIFLVPPSYGTA